jgi:hypothetical protein
MMLTTSSDFPETGDESVSATAAETGSIQTYSNFHQIIQENVSKVLQCISSAVATTGCARPATRYQAVYMAFFS